MKLCEAYEVAHNKRATKKVLAMQLQQSIRLHNHIPLSYTLDSAQYTMECVGASGEGQGIIVRFRRNAGSATATTLQNS